MLVRIGSDVRDELLCGQSQEALSGDLWQDKNTSTWGRDVAGNSQASILAVKANALEVIVRHFIGYLL
jgi:hypothetical protein